MWGNGASCNRLFRRDGGRVSGGLPVRSLPPLSATGGHLPRKSFRAWQRNFRYNPLSSGEMAEWLKAAVR